MNTNRLYNIFAGALVFGTIMSFCCFSWAESLAQKTAPNLPNNTHSNASQKGLLADHDNDGLSDWLQKKLNETPPNQLFDVIVTFKGPGNAQSAQNAVGPFNVKRKFSIINGFSAAMTAAQAKALARVPGVFRVEENFMVYATLDSANRDFGTEAVRNDFVLTGSEIGICVLDTGVDPSHEQLDDGKVAGFEDFIGTATSAYDDHGHGTHVSSIAAGDGIGSSNAFKYKGVAPDAKIYAGKVLDSSGSGAADGIIAGLDWCSTQPGVDIISMSLGTMESSDGQDSLSQAVNNAVLNHGKIAVVAAGNSGSGTYTVGSPGAASEAITVGAAAEWSAPEGSPNHSEGVYLASFSSRGPTANERNKPDVVAPGVSITAAAIDTTNGYVTYSGTSMATPFVSGTVALALEADLDNLTPGEVKERIISTAKDCGPPGLDNDWGSGLLDGHAFVSKVIGTNESNSFPRLQHLEGFVPDNGLWQWSFDVNDSSIPIAVMITIEGEPICPGAEILCQWGLYSWEWTPDLDVELWGPNGFLATSTCMLGNECANYGRQETMHVGTPDTGTYTIIVYPFDGDPNNGKGGNFTVDISTGPLDSDCSDTDSDGDGTADCDDGCPNDPNKTEPGQCGCGTPDTDTDGDGIADCNDPPDSGCTSCFKGDCDGICHPKEVGTDCPDCSSTSTEEVCDDRIDNDGDGFTDCSDSECMNDDFCKNCSPEGESCTSNSDCCSGKCAGKRCK